MICDERIHEAKISRNIWMGKLDPDNTTSDYVIHSCPFHYCKARSLTYTPLSYNLSDSDMCASNRMGVLCGECEAGYGPAVNSPNYECVLCNNTNIYANILQYGTSVYIPLVILFVSLILFDIRLTSGPANAFILYSQVITTTFSLDANGGIPVNQLLNISIDSEGYNYLLQGYKYPYNIFNLNFIERLIPPFCISEEFDTLTVLLLECGVAFLPFAMIILIVIILKFKEC